MRVAELPAARRADVEEAPRFAVSNDQIVCTDAITGCTYVELWDGTEAAALDFAEESGESTGVLIKETRHYAWLRSSGDGPACVS